MWWEMGKKKKKITRGVAKEKVPICFSKYMLKKVNPLSP